MSEYGLSIDDFLDEYRNYYMDAPDERSQRTLQFVMDTAWCFREFGRYIDPLKVPWLRAELDE